MYVILVISITFISAQFFTFIYMYIHVYKFKKKFSRYNATWLTTFTKQFEQIVVVAIICKVWVFGNWLAKHDKNAQFSLIFQWCHPKITF